MDRAARAAWAERTRVGVRTVGELLITVGLLLFLFCAYQLFYTNVVADQAMHSEITDLRRSWAQQAAPTPAPVTRAADKPKTVAPFSSADSAGQEGAAFAILHIPRLGAYNTTPIVEGTNLDVLGRGVGHY